jgi:hypothetical protein
MSTITNDAGLPICAAKDPEFVAMDRVIDGGDHVVMIVNTEATVIYHYEVRYEDGSIDWCDEEELWEAPPIFSPVTRANEVVSDLQKTLESEGRTEDEIRQVFSVLRMRAQ